MMENQDSFIEYESMASVRESDDGKPVTQDLPPLLVAGKSGWGWSGL